MDKAIIFITICEGWENDQTTHLYELEKKCLGVSKGTIEREVRYLLKWGLITREEKEVNGRTIKELIPTQLGEKAWNSIVRSLLREKRIPFDDLPSLELHYTTQAKVTELIALSVVPPKVEVRLDPVLSPILPTLRDILEDLRDNFPLCYAFATGKLRDELKARLAISIGELFKLTEKLENEEAEPEPPSLETPPAIF